MESELTVKIMAIVISCISLVISISAVRIANAKNRSDIICRMFEKYQQIMKNRMHAKNKEGEGGIRESFQRIVRTVMARISLVAIWINTR